MVETSTVQAPPGPQPANALVRPAGAPSITVVLPVYNERDLIAARYAEIRAALQGLSYEIIAVDDGSRDGGFDVLRQLTEGDPYLHVVRLRRSFGRSAALAAGFDRARGALIVTIDADGQTAAADIPRLLEQFERGCDVVSGWRSGIRRPRHVILANQLISATTSVYLHDYGCPLKAYRADVIREMNLYGDLYRFIPAIASWQGVQIAEVEVWGRPGSAAPKRGALLRSVRVLLDLITVRFFLGYAARPMQSFGLIGGGLLLLGSLLGSYLAFVKFGLGQDIGARPLLLLAVLLALVGIQLLVLGLLAELTIRVYYEIQNKPTYLVRETVDAGETSEP
jgi:glycosyltransferase involved in cell wall biosynthesis